MNGAPKPGGNVLKIDAAGLVLAAALAGGAYVLGVEPVYTARTQMEEKRRLIDEQTRNASDSEQLVLRERQRLTALQQRLAATIVRLEPESKLNERLVVISQLVEKHKLAVQALDPGQATGDPEIGRFRLVPIRLSGTGAFTGVASFVRELSEKYKDVEVRLLSMAAPAVNASADPLVTSTAPAGTSSDKTSAPSEKKSLENPPASFVLELRWFAEPAVSAADAGGADPE